MISHSWSRVRPNLAFRVFFTSLLAAAVWNWPSAAGEFSPRQRIVILYSDQRTYREASECLGKVLEERGYESTQIELPSAEDATGHAIAVEKLKGVQPSVIIAAGNAATTLALEEVPTTPVVFFMVPNGRDAPYMQADSGYKDRVAGLTTDISPRDQVEWIARSHPEASCVVAFHSKRTRHSVTELQRVATEFKLDIVPIEADKDKFPQAIDKLTASNCDGVLMVPDARVYNTPTIKRLLLWGIRHKKPVWAFSQNIVKAGAFAGTFPDLENVIQQTATIAQRVLKGEKPESIGMQYPEVVNRAVNQRTAEMISLPITKQMLIGEVIKYGEEQ